MARARGRGSLREMNDDEDGRELLTLGPRKIRSPPSPQILYRIDISTSGHALK
jgi:hypothetical protein